MPRTIGRLRQPLLFVSIVATVTLVLLVSTRSGPSRVQADAGPDLSVTKECTPAQASAGELVSCTITVTNESALSAPNVWVLDDLPDGAFYRDDLSDTEQCELGPDSFFQQWFGLTNVVMCGTIGLGLSNPISLAAQASLEIEVVYEAPADEVDGTSTNRVLVLTTGFGFPVLDVGDPELAPLLLAEAALPPCNAMPDPYTCAVFAVLAAPPQVDNSAEASVQVTPPDLFIDADPTNGSRPCDPVDRTRTVVVGAAYAVAVCSLASPENIQLAVDYNATLSDVPDDAGTPPENLDGNPDLNDGPTSEQVGTDWDCSIGGTNPPAGGDPATLMCSGTASLAAAPGLLATLDLVATAPGDNHLDFVNGSTTIDSTPCTAAPGPLLCLGATIHQVPAPPLSCELGFTGAIVQTGPATYEAAVGSLPVAEAYIPAGKDNLTLIVRNALSAVVAQNSVTGGTPGQQVLLSIPAQNPSPLSVECIVDSVIEATATIEVVGPDLSVTKECTPAAVSAGELVSCTITVTNESALSAPNVWVLDDLPDGAIYRDDLSDSEYCDGPMSLGHYASPTGNVVQCGQIGLGVTSPISLLAQSSMEIEVVYEAAADEFDGVSTNRVLALTTGFGLPIQDVGDPELAPLLLTTAQQTPCDTETDPLTCAVFAVLAAPPQVDNSAEASVQVTPPDLFIDADPTNGSRPCDPVDRTRTVVVGAAYAVAVCSLASPENIQLAVDYNATLSDVPDDAGTPPENLDGNPDLNDGPASEQVGTDWDCSIGGSNPPAGGDPATLMCSGTASLAAAPGLLATLDLVATAPGDNHLDFVNGSTTIDGTPCTAAPGPLLCLGATIDQVPALPLSCELGFTGAIVQTGPETYEAAVGSLPVAEAYIPAGKNNLTLIVRNALSAVVAQNSVTGIPGQQVLLSIPAQNLSPLSVECIVDSVIEATATIEVVGTDLSVTKECTPAVVSAGDLVSCTITVTNESALSAPNVWVLDDLPDGAFYRDDLSDTEQCELDPDSFFQQWFGPTNVVMCGTIGLGLNNPISLAAQASLEIEVVYEAPSGEVDGTSTNRVLVLTTAFGLPIQDVGDPELAPLLLSTAQTAPCDTELDPLTCAVFAVLAAPPEVDNSAEASVQIIPPSLIIDTMPSNGTRPCDPVDPSRSVSVGDTYEVAICAGNTSSLSLSLDYDASQADAADDAGTGPDNLDGNPDLNDGAPPAHLGANWDCSVGGVNPPSGGDPATLTCSGVGQLGLNPGHLATVEFTAIGAGIQQLKFVDANTSLDGAFCAPTGPLGCGSATIRTLAAPPSTCELSLTGTLGESSPGAYIANVNSALAASGRIPAGKDDLTLRVRRPDTSILTESSIAGDPGASHTLGFTASPPGPLTVECVVDGVAESSASVILILIDPSGRVYDLASGGSIPGATVELQVDADPGAGESWVAMDTVTHAGFFEPLLNPETTGVDGRYAWDVAPYYPEGSPDPTNDYRVVVTAPGCTTAISAVVGVPPPALDLDVGLACLDSDDDGLSNDHETSLLGTDPLDEDTDGDGTLDADEDADADGLLNGAEVNVLHTDPLNVDSDGDMARDGDEVALGTSPLVADSDGDGFKDLPLAAHIAVNLNAAFDNCPLEPNPAQENGDATIGNGAGIPGHDGTVPGSDALGDACDPDDDNDGLADASDADPGTPRDFTIDDDGDGIAAAGCFGGTDPDDDGVSWDADCNGKLDGAPVSCGSAIVDADADGLMDAWETCHWGTSNGSADSDGDGLRDCVEAFDVNGNSAVTNGDAVFVQQVVFALIGADWTFDINGNGAITNADAVFIKQAVFNVAPLDVCF